MKDGTPSRTASWAAEMRAAHQLHDDPPIFVDPLALRIIGTDAARQITGNPKKYNNPTNRKVRAIFAARSRFCEEAMAEAVDRGVLQLVILGAGLDTLAYRSPLASRATVFEVDHPATQEWKRKRLASAGITAPPSVVFAPTDFEQMTLAEGLARAGVDLSRPAFLSWLGVVFYLSREVVLSSLSFFGSALSPNSEVVFDYIAPPDTLDLAARRTVLFLSQAAADLGEPWRTFFEPSEIADELQRRGLHIVCDRDAEAAALQFAGTSGASAPLGFTRLARARIGPGA